jgi:hypothetical protein
MWQLVLVGYDGRGLVTIRAGPAPGRNEGGERTRANTCQELATRDNGHLNLREACLNGLKHNGAFGIVVK